MNPLHVSTPAKTGYVELPGTSTQEERCCNLGNICAAFGCPVNPREYSGLRMYYELRGIENEEKVLLIMGASSTCKHLEQLADCLAAHGFQVLTFDNRGLGRSKMPRNEPSPTMTCELLAGDCLALCNAVWGMDSRFHVYGLSLGGWVAQAVALLFINAPPVYEAKARTKQKPTYAQIVAGGAADEQGHADPLMDDDTSVDMSVQYHKLAPLRVKSLHIHGANRGVYLRLPLLPCLYHKRFYAMVLPHVYPHEHAKNIDGMLEKTMTPEYRARVLEGQNKSIEELWRERWEKEFDLWFASEDERDAVAGQYAAIFNWWLTDYDAKRLRECESLHIVVYSAKYDVMISPKEMKALAQLVGGTYEELKGGHMGEIDEKGEPGVLQPLLRHLRRASAVQQQQQQQQQQ